MYLFISLFARAMYRRFRNPQPLISCVKRLVPWLGRFGKNNRIAAANSIVRKPQRNNVERPSLTLDLESFYKYSRLQTHKRLES